MALKARKYWYFNIRTGKVEHGRQSKITVLLGPYRTREEAEKAYHIAAQRNAAWLAQQRRLEADERRDGTESDEKQQSHTQSRSAQADSNQSNDKDADASHQKTQWVSWKDFLDQPASHELEREKHGAPGAPSPVSDSEGDVGAASDPKDPNSFENQLSRFQRRHHEIFGED
jgi:hypothetical protein